MVDNQDNRSREELVQALRGAARPLRPHHLDQRSLEERFKALEDRVAALERARWPHHR